MDSITRFRLAQGMTVAELATACAVSQASIHNLTAGRRNVGIRLAQRIAAVLGVTPDAVLREFGSMRWRRRLASRA